MDDLTIGIIYSLKQPKGNSSKESIINFLSKYTGTPIECYSDNQIKLILRQAFIDYLKTSDNPSFDVWQFFEAKRHRENFRDIYPIQAQQYAERDGAMDDDSEAIIVALQHTKVKDGENFVNGFRPTPKFEEEN